MWGGVSPLQDEGGVGLPGAGVMDVDGVARVGRQLAQRALAAPHALRQAGPRGAPPQGQGAVVSVANQEGVGGRDVAWGGGDVGCGGEK